MSFTLYYLPMRARAEPIRMMLHCANIPYNDKTITFDKWPEHKAALDIGPFGQLPALHLANGEIIAQSGAIVRFVAKLAGIYPVDAIEAAQADMVHEMAQDMNAINALLNFWPMLSDAYIQNRESYFRNFPRQIGYIEKLLGSKEFFGGNTPHYGDFSMFHIMDACLAVEPECLDAFPRTRKWVDNMANIPLLRLYPQKRSTTSNLGMCGSLIQQLVPITADYVHHK